MNVLKDKNAGVFSLRRYFCKWIGKMKKKAYGWLCRIKIYEVYRILFLNYTNVLKLFQDTWVWFI